MYLSQILLDPASHQVQSELSNRYELHRTLTAQFPSNQPKEINLLYRVEIPERQVYQPIPLLVQTTIEPNWSGLSRSGLVAGLPQVKTFSPAFPNGANYYFRLLANPTMRKKQPDNKSKRVGLYSTEAQTEWFKRKAQQGGFTVDCLNLSDHGLVESIKKKNKQTHHIKHLAIQFDGLLCVTDPQLFQKTLLKGIGSAKAFGFGLLSLAKL
jgi:CRISPR system Cascade subunit CasE